MKKICFFIVFSVASGWDVHAGSEALQLAWSKKLRGAISDLRVSKNGKAILVATIPDVDIAGSAPKPLMTRLDEHGKQLWEVVLKSPPKDQDVSADGTLTIVSNYENQLIRLDDEGQVIWTREGMCRPRVLSAAKRILCYHDDDADPKIAFDLYNFEGKKEYSYPIADDIIALKVAADEKHWVIGLSQGFFVGFNLPYNVLVKGRVDGEIIDVAMASGEAPKIAVLYRKQDQSQKIALFDSTGKAVGTQPPKFRAIQIEMDESGGALFYYGNNAQGQHVGRFSLSPFKELWTQGGDVAAYYSSSILVGPHEVFMGFEAISSQDRKSHFLAYDYSGNLKWDLPIATDEGAYLYSQKMAPANKLWVIGTDDARVSAFGLLSK